MDLQPLYEVKERLEHAAIAGTGLLGEDFRLKRSAEALRPLAGASPVFAKITSGLEELLSAPAEERGGRLLSLLALVDAVAYTQGTVGMAGELEPLPVGGGSFCQLSYGQIQPLLTALTTTGGGRMEVVKSAYETRPELFRDYRVLPVLIADLGDSYGELADLNARILKELGRDAAPLLKRGFDGGGKRDMARRAEIIAAVEKEEAVPWLLSVLPEAKKDVRAAVIEGLGASAEQTPLLLELVRSERGRCREAALSALAKQEGEDVRAFWAAELEKNSAAAAFLEKSETPWASDLVAAGFRAFLEGVLSGGGGALSKEQQEELARWSAAAAGKDSPAMLDFWRWTDERRERLDALRNPPGSRGHDSEPSPAERLKDCLTGGLCLRSSDALCALSRELWERNGKTHRYLSQALLAALLTEPAERVYEEFGGYIQTKKPLLSQESKRACHQEALRGLGRLRWDRDLGGYMVCQGEGRPVDVRLDRRWFPRLIDAVWKTPADRKEAMYLPFGAGEPVGEFDMKLVNLANPEDPEIRALLVPYLRRRMVETGNYYSYTLYLLAFGGSPAGVLGKALSAYKKLPYLYHIWSLLKEAEKTLPPEQLILLLREVEDAKNLRAEDIPRSKAAIPYTIDALKEGRPVPEWNEWWNLWS